MGRPGAVEEEASERGGDLVAYGRLQQGHVPLTALPVDAPGRIVTIS
jgi:hypothetical protein